MVLLELPQAGKAVARRRNDSSRYALVFSSEVPAPNLGHATAVVHVL